MNVKAKAARARATRLGGVALLVLGLGLLRTRAVASASGGPVAVGRRRRPGLGAGRRRRRRPSSLSPPSSPSSSLLLRVRGGEGASSPASSPASPPPESPSDRRARLRSRSLAALHATSFLLVAATSSVAFSPLPSLTRHLSSSSSSFAASAPARAVRILSLLSSLSSGIELLLSPGMGRLLDARGRKGPAAALHLLVALGNLIAALKPAAWSVCASRAVNVVCGGFLTVVANSVIADAFGGGRGSGGESAGDGGGAMGAAMGRQAACVSLGFLSGSVAGGRLTEAGERTAYFVASSLALSGAALHWACMPGAEEPSRDDGEKVDGRGGDEASEANRDLAAASGSRVRTILEAPLSGLRPLRRYGPRMRALSCLLLLQSAPTFMGDVFQVYAREEWGLGPKDFANLVAVFGVLGIVSNLTLPPLLQTFGLRTFSLLAILSSQFFPLSIVLSSSPRASFVAGVCGLYGGTQKVGTSAAMTSLAAELGVPQGRIQGEKASMLALLRGVAPLAYGALYLRGKEGTGKAGGKLPFSLNLLLGAAAFVVAWRNL